MYSNPIDPALVAEGRALLQQEGNLNWRWGDLVLRVMPPGSADRGTLVEWAEEIGWLETGRTIATLLSFRTVALAWPPEKRLEGVSFTVHAELAALPERFEVIEPGMTKRQARIAAGKKPEISSKEARGEVVANLLEDPTVLEQLAAKPELAATLRRASAELADRIESKADRDRAERAPDLRRADAAYAAIAGLGRAHREVVSAIALATEVDLREGHLAEMRRRAEAIREAADIAVSYCEGKLSSDSIEALVAAWSEEEGS
jgi:hypothetical protein